MDISTTLKTDIAEIYHTFFKSREFKSVKTNKIDQLQTFCNIIMETTGTFAIEVTWKIDAISIQAFTVTFIHINALKMFVIELFIIKYI